MAVFHVLQGRRVWWVSPTYLMSHHPWMAFKRRFAGMWETKIESQRYLELPNGGSLTVKSADNPDGLRGVGLDFVVVDEAAFVPEAVWTHCLRPALSDRQGKALIISTPCGRNWFFQVFQLGQDPAESDWESWSQPTAANPCIPAEEIEQARRLLPERVFRQEYLARFLADGGAVFRGIYRAAVAPPGVIPQPGHRYVMGIDFGRYEDFTACVIIDVDERRIVAIDRYNEAAWNLQRLRINELARHWNVEVILAESNAMGDPNIEELRRRHGLPVYPFTMTAANKPALVEGLVVAIENGDLKLVNDPLLIGELEAFTYRLTATGHTVYSAPEGRHDDLVIALALAWKQASTPRIALASVEV